MKGSGEGRHVLKTPAQVSADPAAPRDGGFCDPPAHSPGLISPRLPSSGAENPVSRPPSPHAFTSPHPVLASPSLWDAFQTFVRQRSPLPLSLLYSLSSFASITLCGNYFLTYISLLLNRENHEAINDYASSHPCNPANQLVLSPLPK